jgi:hypothetical protein
LGHGAIAPLAYQSAIIATSGCEDVDTSWPANHVVEGEVPIGEEHDGGWPEAAAEARAV